jgi:hypothetical protein
VNKTALQIVTVAVIAAMDLDKEPMAEIVNDSLGS